MRHASQSLIAIVVGCLTALGPMQARANGRTTSTIAAPARSDELSPQETLDRATTAWGRGDYGETRRLLEPFVESERTDISQLQLESGLRYLADAVLLDQNLDASDRQRLARMYLEKILAIDSRWRPPPGLHSISFYELTSRMQAERESALAANCTAERMACQADLRERQADYRRLRADYEVARTERDEKLVVVEDRVARNRAVALLPFGVAHFYNGRNGLGAGFLAAEAAFGAIGLGLLLNRVYVLRCDRTDDFNPRSLRCNPPADISAQQVRTRRRLEQAFGILLVATVATDVIVAQLTFKPFSTVGKRSIRRKELGTTKFDRRTLRVSPALSPANLGLNMHLSF